MRATCGVPPSVGGRGARALRLGGRLGGRAWRRQVEAERLTIARLGPAQALADQLLADLRSGALGRRGRLAVSLTTARLVAVAVVLVIAIVAGAVLVEGRSSSAPPAGESTRTVVLTNKDVHALVLTLQANVQVRYTRGARPAVLRLAPTR